MSRSVLVTGGSRGIGLAIARRLVAAEHRVAVTYRTTAPPDGLFAVPCDVRDVAEVDDAFDKVAAEQGPVEVLISNAGAVADTLLLRMSDAHWSDVLDANLTGAFNVARRAAAPMVRNRFGRLVFVSSVVAFAGSPGQANYGAAKAGLVGLARSLARELAPRNITANVVAPGLIDTDMTSALGGRRDALIASTPIGRIGTCAEVAALVGFLCSDDASYITGAVIPVDGGLGMGL